MESVRQKMTSDEIMQALKRKDINDTMKAKLREILVLSDLVKFAKENPLPDDHEFCFNASIGFVNETAETKEQAVEPAQSEPNKVESNTVAT